MRRANCDTGIRQSGFTFVETLLAAAITAITAAAGATLIFAITSAAAQTRDVRATKTKGQYALARFARAVQEARVIGDVTPEKVLLWIHDVNDYDVPNLDEMAVIAYDSGARQLCYTFIENPTPGTTDVLVSDGDLKNADAIEAHLASAEARTVVWSEEIETLEFSGYPADTETRIVNVRFTIGTGADEVAFQTAASPKAPADYLFEPAAREGPLSGSTRMRRKDFSRWDGFSDLTGG